MPSSPGRSTDARAVTNVGTTSASTAITFTASTILAGDVGRSISGTGIPAGAKIATVSSTTAGTLSVNATATGTVTATLASDQAGASQAGFIGWTPETAAESAVFPISGGAGAADPSRLTDAVTRAPQRNR